MKDPHYRDFFRGLGLTLWRKSVDMDDTQSEVDFLLDTLELGEPSNVLDIPCGYGRHGLALAELGHNITGVDLSEDYLREAAQVAENKNLPLTLAEIDMRDIAFYQEFDAAYCLGNSFGIFDYDDTFRFLEGISESLKPGGRFLLESGMLAETFLPHFEKRLWQQIDDVLVVMENTYTPADSTVLTRYRLIQEEKQEVREIQHWIFTIAEVRRMLEEVGLMPEGLCADIEGTPFEVGHDKIYMVAVKS